VYYVGKGVVQQTAVQELLRRLFEEQEGGNSSQVVASVEKGREGNEG